MRGENTINIRILLHENRTFSSKYSTNGSGSNYCVDSKKFKNREINQ